MDYSAQQNHTVHTLALDHVSFAIQAGESIAVMGPSGSGKSTLLHVLAGIIAPTAGTVVFKGVDLARMSDADRTKLRRNAFGFVFQSGQLLPELPAVENIALPMMLGGADYRQATDAAMLWFADEPTGALDQQTGHEIMGILMQAARSTGAAVIVVTHDPNVAAFCNHTVTMRDGRLYLPKPAQPGPSTQSAQPARTPSTNGGAR